jgi:hypothetical protein
MSARSRDGTNVVKFPIGHVVRFERLGARQDALHDGGPWDDRRRAESDALADERWERVHKARSLLYGIRKLRATTGAGIYAKALVVRSSVTGAAELAMSWAEDLVACSELRATLWPSGREPQP